MCGPRKGNQYAFAAPLDRQHFTKFSGRLWTKNVKYANNGSLVGLAETNHFGNFDVQTMLSALSSGCRASPQIYYNNTKKHSLTFSSVFSSNVDYLLYQYICKQYGGIKELCGQGYFQGSQATLAETLRLYNFILELLLVPPLSRIRRTPTPAHPRNQIISAFGIVSFN